MTTITTEHLYALAPWVAGYLPDFYAAAPLSSEDPQRAGLLVGAMRPGMDVVSSRVEVAQLDTTGGAHQPGDPVHRALVAVLNAYVAAARDLSGGTAAERQAWKPWGEPAPCAVPIRPQGNQRAGRDVGQATSLWAADILTSRGGRDRDGAAQLVALVLGAPGGGQSPAVMAGALAGVFEGLMSPPVDPVAVAAGLLPVPDPARLDAAGKALSRDVALYVPAESRGRLYALLAWLAWMGGRSAEARHWLRAGRKTHQPLGLLGDVAASVPVAPWRLVPQD